MEPFLKPADLGRHVRSIKMAVRAPHLVWSGTGNPSRDPPTGVTRK